MATTIIQFECQGCGATYPKWQGKCNQCHAWDTLVETQSERQTKKSVKQGVRTKVPVSLSSIQVAPNSVVPTHISELDHVLNQGFAQGSITLLGGEPGIGKSTLSLQIAQSLAKNGAKVLYISGEESTEQLFLRATRLQTPHPNVMVLAEVNMDHIMHHLNTEKPDVVILDSIQVVHQPELSSMAGTISQVRSCADVFIQWVKQHQVIGILIGHITKDGHLAGPKVLEHLVDVILYLEGERSDVFRILRCFKNRYGSTHEIGVFKMSSKGLEDVKNPSELFIDTACTQQPGSVITAITKGSRIFLVEIQALVVHSGYGMAKRSVVGVNVNRAHLMIAAIEKNLKLPLGSKDIFLNIIGGLTVTEPALDLAMVMAIMASLNETPLPPKVAVLGEVGLTGEVRAIPHAQKRVHELAKMGFKACYLPAKNKLRDCPDGFTPYYTQHIQDLVEVAA